MELPKPGRENLTPRKGLVAVGASIAAVAFGGCGFWDERKEPIILPPEAKERVDGGGDRAFVINDTPLSREVVDCGKIVKNQGGDRDNTDPEFVDIGEEGKVLVVCEGVGQDFPLELLSDK
jgi:hypothetical protein